MRVVQPEPAARPTFGNADGEQLEVGTLAALDREDWPRDVAVYYLHEEQDGQEQGAWYPGVAEGFDANTNSLWVRFNDEPDADNVDVTQDPVVWATPQESRPIAQSSRTQVSHRARTHTRARTCTHTHTHTNTCARSRARTHAHTHTHEPGTNRLPARGSSAVWVVLSLKLLTKKHTHAHTHARTHTNTHTNTHTHTHTHTQTYT